MNEVRARMMRSLSCADIVNREKTTAELETFESESWASATFEGHRHCFTVRFGGFDHDVGAAAGALRRAISDDDVARK